MKTIRLAVAFALANFMLAAQDGPRKTPAPNPKPKPNEIILHQGTSVENFPLQLFLTDLYQPITEQQLAVQKILKTITFRCLDFYYRPSVCIFLKEFAWRQYSEFLYNKLRIPQEKF